MYIKLIKSASVFDWIKIIARFSLFATVLSLSVYALVIIYGQFIVQENSKQKSEIQSSLVLSKDLELLKEKISYYEKLEEKQAFQLKKLENDYASAVNTNKQLEKRLEAHTEAIKRICEFIVIITVDKKIIPRQCLPQYNWRKEDGN
jgi:hypothetical protein